MSAVAEYRAALLDGTEFSDETIILPLLWRADPMIVMPQCLLCRRFRRDRKRTCDAYPDGIPLESFKGEVDHTKPHMGDHGLTFLDAVDDEPSGRSAPFRDVPCTGDEDAEARKKPGHGPACASGPDREI